VIIGEFDLVPHFRGGAGGLLPVSIGNHLNEPFGHDLNPSLASQVRHDLSEFAHNCCRLGVILNRVALEKCFQPGPETGPRALNSVTASQESG
jgi:hypothetical protein